MLDERYGTLVDPRIKPSVLSIHPRHCLLCFSGTFIGTVENNANNNRTVQHLAILHGAPEHQESEGIEVKQEKGERKEGV
ncbi:hypothetical protein RSOLAG1IB_00578 [Rhizoctonia solani AG-1 IB]|uniref:Uncharacterized protein n=1 Tax=Thanatephorus cucumeris (strain AG1-IB / isolate 7/3/14) TaxID=1108050 RepID=A0A0B7F1X8_THACB|nr:hypothetical protein RSOLAG1IB_00578 [Rhizoctonia solani AG-1 IB]